MLDHYLNVVSERMQKEAALASFVDRLSLLPPAELALVRQTGEIKLAFCDDEWLQKFHGSPLAQKAIALAEQQLRMDAEQSSQREEFDAEREGLRLERRLLELELAKAEAGVSSPAPAAAPLPSAGGSPPMTAPPPEASPPAGSKMAAAKKNPYDEMVSTPSGQAALMSAGIHGADSLARGRGVGRSALSALGGYMTGRTAGEIGERSDTMGGSALGGAASSVIPALLLSSRPGMHILTSAGAGAYAHHKSKQKSQEKEAAMIEGEEPQQRSSLLPYLAGGAALGGLAYGAYSGRQVQKNWPQVVEQVQRMNPELAKHMDLNQLKDFTVNAARGIGGVQGAIGGGVAGYGAHHLMNKDKEASAEADAWGRALAHGELERLEDVEKMASLGQSMMTFAKKNPALVAGGVLGAAHGALREDGGLGSAILEGAGGAALGAGGHAAYNHLRSKGLPGSGMMGGGSAPAGLLGQGPAPIMAGEGIREKVGSIDKEAFGAALASGIAKAAPAITGWLKSNPLKAGLGAVNAISNFHQARQGGDSLGGALLSGAGGAAGAAL
jgi:hypothetical protein